MRKIPEPTVLRLSTYRRCLEDFKAQTNLPFVSSNELGRLAHRNAAIVRKDLSYFGEYGVPGKGYSVDHLLKHILRIMNLRREHRAVLVGAGNLGRALLGYPGFKKLGFRVVAAFDNDPRKVGRKIGEVAIFPVSKLKSEVERKKPAFGLITVPAAAAQESANLLVEAGVRAIINFAPARVWVPPRIVLRNVDLTRELEVASYYLG
ncbi:redox-sensing transcriptional repressor Rex [candidate division WOR-1 bacterium RIFCSPHIGHO2_01_FULL_53_15]|uniref:Redox-sensing transcriptional repressor Rex n=1 Tax=candidate division WOR-1 bacterium RIFCSPHIGHO2_01_FULL_53_15 TaxID=1802564 RepID=A0A1F4Q3D4_UNCSA|nr:MAG: redox-sensing transcriptional repressor Rex [candidate division WOR-1 bacterium RIFCSPHIGHO2_01_FULL_53_15]OGC12664.1 MAG: redox-sensing transcriptional repressor Rex [candidate division WOR-1 bacterium RIFCSPHIGHO2_02_FULL_53_26]